MRDPRRWREGRPLETGLDSDGQVADCDRVVDRLPLTTAARTTKMGLLVGVGYGLAQDALSLVRGRRLDYVDWLLGGREVESGAKA